MFKIIPAVALSICVLLWFCRERKQIATMHTSMGNCMQGWFLIWAEWAATQGGISGGAAWVPTEKKKILLLFFLFVCIHFLQFWYCSFTRQVNNVMLLCGKRAAGRPLFYKGASPAAESITDFVEEGGRGGGQAHLEQGIHITVQN